MGLDAYVSPQNSAEGKIADLSQGLARSLGRMLGGDVDIREDGPYYGKPVSELVHGLEAEVLVLETFVEFDLPPPDYIETDDLGECLDMMKTFVGELKMYPKDWIYTAYY